MTYEYGNSFKEVKFGTNGLYFVLCKKNILSQVLFKIYNATAPICYFFKIWTFIICTGKSIANISVVNPNRLYLDPEGIFPNIYPVPSLGTFTFPI